VTWGCGWTRRAVQNGATVHVPANPEKVPLSEAATGERLSAQTRAGRRPDASSRPVVLCPRQRGRALLCVDGGRRTADGGQRLSA
jgi:hypothetical protein